MAVPQVLLQPRMVWRYRGRYWVSPGLCVSGNNELNNSAEQRLLKILQLVFAGRNFTGGNGH